MAEQEHAASATGHDKLYEEDFREAIKNLDKETFIKLAYVRPCFFFFYE